MMETNVIINDQDKLWEMVKWVTPIVLFFAGYLINEFIRKSIHKKELRVLEDLLLSQLQQLHQQVVDQTEHNSDCIHKSQSFDENDIRLKRHYGTNIERIRKIPFKDIFQILVNDPIRRFKKRDYYVERFNKLFRIIDYFESGISSSYINNDMIIRNLNEFLEKWNQSQKQILNFRNLLVSTLNSQNIPISNDSFLFDLVETIKGFENKYGKDIQNLELAFNEYIVPLIELTKKYSNDTRSAYLMGILQESKHAYIETSAQRKLCSDELIELNNSLLKFNPELNKIIEEIKNKA
jgi:hypothetical protein